MASESDQVRPKRASEDGDCIMDLDSKRQRLEELSSEVRILLASRNAGAVIGKGGDVIKRLRETYNCIITLPDSQGPERILNISGKAANIVAILEEIIPKLDKERDMKDDEIRMLVHQNLAGRIIGKQGVTVKELSNQSGAEIKVYTECCPESTERVVQLTGKPDQVAMCVGLILELLADAVQRGMNMPYDPSYADESYASEYGGFTDPRRRGRGGGMGRGAPFPGARGGFGRMAGGDMYGGGGGAGFGGSPGFNEGGFGRMPAPGPAFGMGGASPPAAMGFGGGRTETSQVSIPKNVAGAILGKAGSRMKQIQMESNTSIKMEGADVEGNERIITITGSPDAIQYAQYLLQQAVKQHAGPLGGRR
jgi:heterogeneous nuclear ribonucleoprotein K